MLSGLGDAVAGRGSTGQRPDGRAGGLVGGVADVGGDETVGAGGEGGGGEAGESAEMGADAIWVEPVAARSTKETLPCGMPPPVMEAARVPLP